MVILYGYYCDWYGVQFCVECLCGCFGMFGGVCCYKGVFGFVDVYVDVVVRDFEISMIIGGKVLSVEFVEDLWICVVDLLNVVLELEFFSDVEFVQFVIGFELIVFVYCFMYNLGSVLVVFFFDCLVFVLCNVLNEVFVVEVGLEWVQMYDGEVDVDVFLEVFCVVWVIIGKCFDLLCWEWDDVGVVYVVVYWEVLWVWLVWVCFCGWVVEV